MLLPLSRWHFHTHIAFFWSFVFFNWSKPWLPTQKCNAQTAEPLGNPCGDFFFLDTCLFLGRFYVFVFWSFVFLLKCYSAMSKPSATSQQRSSTSPKLPHTSKNSSETSCFASRLSFAECLIVRLTAYLFSNCPLSLFY